MAKTFFLRDTNQANGIHAADFEDEMAATAGAGEIESATLAGGESRLTHLWATLSTEPDSAAWPTGDYRCLMDVSAAGSAITYGLATAGTETGHFARVNSGLTSDLETKAQTEALFSGTGQKTATTGSVSWSTGATGDRFECLLAATRSANHGNQKLDVTYNTNSFADGPWSAGLTIDADFIASGNSLSEPTLSPGAVTIAAGFIAAASALFTPVVDSNITVNVPFISSGNTLFLPSVSPGPVTLSADFLASGNTLSEPTVSPGEATASPDFIASGNTLFEPSVTSGLTVNADFLSSGNALFGPTLSPGAVTANQNFIATGNALYEPSVTGGLTVNVDFISSGNALSLPTLSAGPITANIDFLGAGNILSEPTLTSGVSVNPDYIVTYRRRRR